MYKMTILQPGYGHLIPIGHTISQLLGHIMRTIQETVEWLLTESLTLGSTLSNFHTFQKEMLQLKKVDAKYAEDGYRPVRSQSELESVRGALWGHNNKRAEHESNHGSKDDPSGVRYHSGWASYGGRLFDVTVVEQGGSKEQHVIAAHAFWRDGEGHVRQMSVFEATVKYGSHNVLKGAG